MGRLRTAQRPRLARRYQPVGIPPDSDGDAVGDGDRNARTHDTGARRPTLCGAAELGQQAHRSCGNFTALHLPGVCALHRDAGACRRAVLRHPARFFHQRHLGATGGLVRSVGISGGRGGSDQRARVRARPRDDYAARDPRHAADCASSRARHHRGICRPGSAGHHPGICGPGSAGHRPGICLHAGAGHPPGTCHYGSARHQPRVGGGRGTGE